MSSPLLERQWLFSACLGKLLIWIHQQGWAVAMAEGFVGYSINKPGEDTPHIRKGNHFKKLAQDLDLWVPDENGNMVGPIANGDHPAWRAIGAYWKSLSPLCAWGGDFPGDANHVSIEYQGIK